MWSCIVLHAFSYSFAIPADYRSSAGIPPLERSYAERYGGQPQYEAYKAATNLLFPWPPRDKFP